jgi:hypothetical protein
MLKPVHKYFSYVKSSWRLMHLIVLSMHSDIIASQLLMLATTRFGA